MGLLRLSSLGICALGLNWVPLGWVPFGLTWVQLACVGEADTGADHPRQLVWEPTQSQKRSLGVRLPAKAAAPAPGAAYPAAAKAAPKPKAVQPRGSVKVEIDG